MKATDLFVGTFGLVVPGDEESLIAVVSNAVRNGFAIVLDKPGTKIPMCILGVRDAKTADREYQDAARAAGDERWSFRRHPCGIHHALTVSSLGGDPAKVRTKVSQIIRRVTKAHGGELPNIGVEPGRSRLLVVDVDTAAEVAGFNDSRDAAGDHALAGMTVRSPGSRDEAGNVVHADGGHFWFSLPADVELPPGQGVLKDASGWTAIWADHQVLVPPSKRPEGVYTIIGQMPVAPRWLTERIISEAQERADRVRARLDSLPDGTGEIDLWSARTPWRDLLEPDGWVDTGLPDRCSCPIFTAPGPHSSRKSATAHDIGCDHFDTGVGHAPLHIWTDNPPDEMAEAIRRTGTKTYTKIQYVAWSAGHEGNIGLACQDLGMAPATVAGHGITLDVEEPDWVSETPKEERTQAKAPQTPQDPFSRPGAAQADPEGPPPETGPQKAADTPEADGAEPGKERTLLDALRDQLVSSAELDEIEDPEPLVEGFLDLDTIARITGKSGKGKSFVMLDMAACIATGQPWHGFATTPGPVIFMVAEGLRGMKKRVRAWEARFNGGEHIPADRLYLLKVPVQVTALDHWKAFIALCAEVEPVLVILDTQARITVGVDENDAKEMGIFVDRLEQVRRKTGACVVTVHHLGHQGEHGRGSTAVLGALGAELRVSSPAKDKVVLESEKQKDGPKAEALKFLMDEELDSVVLVPDGWVPEETDPFATPPFVPVPAKDRAFTLIWEYLSGNRQGFTKAEAMKVIKDKDHAGEPGEERRPMHVSGAYKVWGQMVTDGWIIPVTTASGSESVSRFTADPARAADLDLGAPNQSTDGD